LSLIPDLGVDKKELPNIIGKYESYLSDVEKHLKVKGKTLQNANQEHASWLYYYSVRMQELNVLVKYFDREVERVRGKLWKQYTENHNRDLNTRDKENYINNEPAYLTIHEMALEVQDLYKKYEAVVEAFKARGYALNNIVKVRTAAIEDDEI
jgi:hypothetical protein